MTEFQEQLKTSYEESRLFRNDLTRHEMGSSEFFEQFYVDVEGVVSQSAMQFLAQSNGDPVLAARMQLMAIVGMCFESGFYAGRQFQANGHLLPNEVGAGG